jgi:hypothetical protein
MVGKEKSITSGAKARDFLAFFGTAEAVPSRVPFMRWRAVAISQNFLRGRGLEFPQNLEGSGLLKRTLPGYNP